MASSSSSPNPAGDEQDEELDRLILQVFLEYEKTYGGRIPASSSVRGGFVRHGTTCVSIINKLGLLFGGDGLARNFNPNNLKDNRIVSENERKVFFTGERMIISIAGNTYWIRHIWRFLRPRIENPDPAMVAYWTCQRCAHFVYHAQAVVGPRRILDKYNLKDGALDGKFCSMMFGAYENNEARLFYADDERVERIFDADAYDPNQLGQNEHEGMSCRPMGSGGAIANNAMFRIAKLEGINIGSGVVSHFEEQLILLLSSMKVACDKNEDTGGDILVYYMPPPPGAAHIVYNEPYQAIPLDIARLRADMYHRLYEEAREAGSIMADDYRDEFLQHSLLYEAQLKEHIRECQRFGRAQDRRLQELTLEDRRLMRRRRRLA